LPDEGEYPSQYRLVHSNRRITLNKLPGLQSERTIWNRLPRRGLSMVEVKLKGSRAPNLCVIGESFSNLNDLDESKDEDTHCIWNDNIALEGTS
jgi:hypothetical protein